MWRKPMLRLERLKRFPIAMFLPIIVGTAFGADPPKGPMPAKVIEVGAAVDHLDWSPDGKQLAVQSRTWEGEGRSTEVTGHLLEIRDAENGKVTKSLIAGQNVRGALYLAGGKMVAAIIADSESRKTNLVVLVDSATGKEIRSLRGASEECFWLGELAGSSDGRLVVGVGPRFDDKGGVVGGEVDVWEVATGKLLWQNKDHTSYVDGAAFSPDGKILATGSRDRSIRLWDVATGKHLRTLNGHGEGGSLRVAFSPDGQTLASGGLDGSVRLWEVATGRQIRLLTAGYAKGGFVHVAFSPDGKALATSGTSTERGLGNVTLWNVATGQPTCVYPEPTNATTLAFSPDGKRLAAGIWPKRLYLLNVGEPK